MSSPTGSSQWIANPGSSFYNGVATRSVRFDDTAQRHLARTPSSASNRRTWTWSGWLKRSRQDYGIIFGAADNNNPWGINETTYIAYGGSTHAIRVFHNSTVLRELSGYQRDFSGWFHLVVAFDTTDSTAADRHKVYINGVKVETFDTQNNLNANTDTFINLDVNQVIGGQQTNTANSYLNAYMSEVNFIDGLQLTPTSFGESKNGIWIAKETSGLTFGTNGYRLRFDQKGTGTASSSTIGADTSGNDNHWTSGGLAAQDCAMQDSPENNFATWNENYRMYGDTGYMATTQGGLFVTGGGNVNSDRSFAMSTMSVNEILRNSDGAGAYMEVRSPGVGGDNGYIGLLGQTRVDQKGDSATVRSDNSGHSNYHLISPNGRTLLEAGESSSSALSGLNGTQTDDAVIGFAIKTDGKFFISVDGTFSTNAAGAAQNPVSGANPFGTIDLTVDFFFHAGNISLFQANFGQDSTFGGNETATSNADANGIGEFHTAPPTGYLAMCTANMPEPAVGPNSDTQSFNHFGMVKYTGNNTDNKAVTGLQFQPDLLFLFPDSNSTHNLTCDSGRGVNENHYLSSASAEVDDGAGIKSFNSNGFTLGTSANWNANNRDYYTYAWRANGGTATATISESGNNPAAVVQANPAAGISIITYTGTGATGTIAHGLGAVPTLILVKNRDTNDSWNVFHVALGAGEVAYLNLAADTDTNQANWNNTAPTSSVFTVNTDASVNTNDEAYTAYVFADVPGFSKHGSYIGNHNADGHFSYTGFRPAFLIIKKRDGNTGWEVTEALSSDGNPAATENPIDQHFLVETKAAQSTNDAYDFYSNGWKLRSTGYTRSRNAGEVYIYISFAEAPFKYANARM